MSQLKLPPKGVWPHPSRMKHSKLVEYCLEQREWLASKEKQIEQALKLAEEQHDVAEKLSEVLRKIAFSADFSPMHWREIAKEALTKNKI